MAKSKKRKQTAPFSDQDQQTTEQSQEEKPQRFAWIPLWGWILIFLVPLVISEYMFYVVGRWPSMILFPVAWIGFWVIIMRRSGWAILKKRKDG
jgi:hypothetical protein